MHFAAENRGIAPLSLRPYRAAMGAQARLRLGNVLRATVLTVAIGTVCALGLRVVRPGWEVQAPAMRLEALGAELFFLDAPKLVRRGPSRLVVIRIEGDVQIVPHHYRAHGMAHPQSIDRWAEAIDAPLLINAGQFDDAGEHLGWLRSQGAWLRTQRHPNWLGLLVSAPQPAVPVLGRTTRIVDLAREAPNVAHSYDNIVQSMMLIDQAGRARVRNSEQAACRTVVAEDRQGRLVIVLTEGAVTLRDLATYLRHSSLQIVSAMNLDGGIESQLALHSPEIQLHLFGQYGAERTALGPHQVMMGRAPLPAVLAISPHPKRL